MHHGCLVNSSSDLAASIANNTKKPLYFPPEVLEGQKPTKESDVWGLGLTIYVLVCGSLPFKSVKEVKEARITFPRANHLSEDFKDLVTSMLHKDPAQRSKLDTILKSAWFNQFYDNE